MFKRMMVAVVVTGLVMSAFGQELPEEKKTGGAGCFEIGFTSLDLEPLEKVVKKDLDKGGFDFDRNIFFTIGGQGYFGPHRNGIRLGWGGWGGYNSKFSAIWSGRADSAYIDRAGDTLVDSVIQLHTLFAHTGLILERSFSLTKNLNVFAGGMIGGGIMAAIADRRSSKGAFREIDNDYDYDDDDDDSLKFEGEFLSGTSAALAPLFAFDLHGGLTYSVTNWMHLGIDASAVCYYSNTGFGYKYGNFMTVNPGVRVRVIFGNVV
ncbi:MAG: hypothetical protein GX556_17590 [Fibrobacter sp.]|nr:hypothetical protein [Fibrobacter sp.]